MNIKMKALAAAIAMAVSGGAFAATSQTTTGNSEMVFTVWDPVAKVSFSADLYSLATAPGMGTFNLNDFLPGGVTAGGSGTTGDHTYTMAPGSVEAKGTQFVWNMATYNTNTNDTIYGANGWNQFVAASNPANWQWQVFAGDSAGTTAQKDQIRYIITSKDTLSNVDTISLNGLTGLKAIQLTQIGLDAALENDPGQYRTEADGGSYSGTSPTGLGYQIQSNSPVFTVAGLGESMNMYYVTGNCVGAVCSTDSNGANDKTRAQQFANGAHWTFAQNATTGAYELTYATVVPVPAAVWLLGSALVGMVGVSRRKSA